MTPPTPPQAIIACPSCGKGHQTNPEFGPYCDLGCLTTAMMYRTVLTSEEPPRFAERSKHHAS